MLESNSTTAARLQPLGQGQYGTAVRYSISVENRPRVPRWVWSLLLSISFTCICALGFLLKFAKQFGEPTENLKSEIAGATKEGIPLKPADLLRKPLLSDTSNAAIEYQMAGDLYAKIKPPHEGVDAVLKNMASPQQVQEARAELVAMQPVLDLIEKGALKSDCALPHPEVSSPSKWMTPLSLALKSYWPAKILLSNTSEVTRQTASLHNRVSGHLLKQPITLPILVALTARHAWEGSLIEFAKRNPSDAKSLGVVMDAFSGLPDLPDYKLMFGAEVVEQRDAFELASQCKGPLGLGDARRSFEMLCQMRGKEDATALVSNFDSRFIHGARMAWKVLPVDPHDYRAAELGLLEPLKAENSDSSSVSEFLGNYLRIQDLWEGIIAREHSLRRAQAMDRISVSFAWLMNQKQSAGSFPKTLPARPDWTDPYSETALVYEKTANGCRIYSVGPSGKGADAPKGDLLLAQYP